MASTQRQVDAPLPAEMLKQLEQFKKNLNRMREELEKQKEFQIKLCKIVCPASGEEKDQKQILMTAFDELQRKKEAFLQDEKNFLNKVCDCLECLPSEKLWYWEKFLELV